MQESQDSCTGVFKVLWLETEAWQVRKEKWSQLHIERENVQIYSLVSLLYNFCKWYYFSVN